MLMADTKCYSAKLENGRISREISIENIILVVKQ